MPPSLLEDLFRTLIVSARRRSPSAREAIPAGRWITVTATASVRVLDDRGTMYVDGVAVTAEPMTQPPENFR